MQFHFLKHMHLFSWQSYPKEKFLKWGFNKNYSNCVSQVLALEALEDLHSMFANANIFLGLTLGSKWNSVVLKLYIRSSNCNYECFLSSLKYIWQPCLSKFSVSVTFLGAGWTDRRERQIFSENIILDKPAYPIIGYWLSNGTNLH